MEVKNKNNHEGIVLNIQRFTVHDGPGIRTEIFLKGCPLHCKWCSNPESINAKQEVGITSSRCIGIDKCGFCFICPQKAEGIFIINDNKVCGINRELCKGCLKCAEECPANALKIWGKKMSVKQVVEVVQEDRIFYENSGGGITISGGEPLSQWQFVLEILRECINQGINTCVESTLHCKTEVLESIAPYTNLLITDIKHMDTEKHRELTGVSNELILENIKKAVQIGMNLVIRIPVIPDHNDTIENLRATAEYIINELDNKAKQVQLLRYRRLGEEKYKTLGIEYTMGNLMEDSASEEKGVFERKIIEFAHILQEYNIPAVAGSTKKINL